MGGFEKPGKPRAWHTAFYFLAEHIRYLTDGSINHKALYTLVGTKVRFVNHPNPIVRKRTAAELSRTVHTKAYAEDMCERFKQDETTFDTAAQSVCDRIVEAGVIGAEEIGSYLYIECWPDVFEGLKNERLGSRPLLDLERVAREADLVFGDCRDGASVRAPEPWIQMASLFRLISFGYLNVDRARMLMGLTDELPPVRPGMIASDTAKCQDACLVRFEGGNGNSVAGFWVLPMERPFVMGRFTDCDSVESDVGISRRHACVSYEQGEWYFEDLRSKNGSNVIRAGRDVMTADSEGNPLPVALMDGDSIVLAGKSRYWFGPFSGRTSEKRA